MPFAPTRPDSDELEITLIGPGQGECCLVHLGNGRWIVVDSCRDTRTKRPVALAYLSEIGVEANAVELIIATHWHDDHISGLAETVRSCTKAKFCCSSVLGSNEFLATVAPYKDRLQFSGGSGVSEIFEVLEELRASNRMPAIRAAADRRLAQIDSDLFDHNRVCEIWSLSPSDAQVQAFYAEIGDLVPQLHETKRRLPAQNRNLLSVVTLVQIGSFAALLGADLEVTKNPNTGWNPIVHSTGRPKTQSSIFKVPHHGSENGHCPNVWASMLEPKPISLTTPYSGGRKPLPSSDDEQRIATLSSDFFVSASNQPGKLRNFSKAVERTIYEQGIKIRPLEPRTGAVRLRNKVLRNPSAWSVEFDGNAYRSA